MFKYTFNYNLSLVTIIHVYFLLLVIDFLKLLYLNCRKASRTLTFNPTVFFRISLLIVLVKVIMTIILILILLLIIK